MLADFIKSLAKDKLSVDDLVAGDQFVTEKHKNEYGETVDTLGFVVKKMPGKIKYTKAGWDGRGGKMFYVDKSDMVGSIVARLVGGEKKFFTVVE